MSVATISASGTVLMTSPLTKIWPLPLPLAYRESVLPSSVTARVSVEAGIALTWRDIVGDRGRSVSIEHFGASADYQTLFEKFGITTEAVVAAARETLEENAA